MNIRIAFKGMNIKLRYIYTVAIAILPVIMSFKIPFVNIGFSTAIICLFIPYAFLHLWSVRNFDVKFLFIIVLGYFMYRSLNVPFNIFLILLVLTHVLGATSGSIDIRILRKTIEIISYSFAFIIFAQTLVFYVGNIRTSLLMESMLLDADKYYVANQLSLTGLYRPSAFFLEPSHYAEYCCIGLLSVLFPGSKYDVNIRKAIVICIGCLLTTSGIGMALCFGLFFAYALFAQRNKKNRIMYIFLWLLAGLAVISILSHIPLFQTMLLRITGDVGGYNAIWGRTLYWDSYINSMSSHDKILGFGYGNLPSGYMTGLMLLIYCYGYMGVVLLLSALVFLLLKYKEKFSLFLVLMYCSLMCFANLFGFIGLTFWLTIIVTSAIYGKYNYA